MEKLMVLDIMTAINEMIENEELNQFETLTEEVFHSILEKAKEIANEK